MTDTWRLINIANLIQLLRNTVAMCCMYMYGPSNKLAILNHQYFVVLAALCVLFTSGWWGFYRNVRGSSGGWCFWKHLEGSRDTEYLLTCKMSYL